MLNPQRANAPDTGVWYSDGATALGRRLHRLLREDAFDTGPIVDARGRMLLGDMAHLSDAATSSAALFRWDEAALDRVVGDFAFAPWGLPADGC